MEDGTERGQVTSASAAAGGPISNAIIRVTRLHMMVARQLLRGLGLYPGQELLLMHLWDAGPTRQSVLATAFDTDSAAMTRSVQRLERAGLVERLPDPSDGRATLVAPTAASHRMRREMERLWRELEELTVGDMSSSDREALSGYLSFVEGELLDALQARVEARDGHRSAGARSVAPGD